jgi:hypothetical protein
VVIHVIPRSIIWTDRYQGVFWPEELDSAANLKAIPLKNLGSESLTDFRKDWINFVATPRERPTREQLLNFAASLLIKHKSLFES